MKKIFAILSAVVTGVLLSPLVVIVLSAALVVLLIPVNMLLNNAGLKAFEHSFAAITHPEASESLAMSSRFGNIGGGSSDSCDYFVGNLRSTTLPRKTITNHYADATIASPDPFIDKPTDIEIWFFGEATRPPEPSLNLLFSKSEHWEVDLSKYADKTLYITYALERGAPAGLDIRCH